MSAPEHWAATALETTLPQLFSRNAHDFPDHPALSDTVASHRRNWTWSQAWTDAHALAAGLAELGLQPGQTVLIMVANRAEHWLADAAATLLGAVPSTVYDTLSSDQVLYTARHSRARIAVLQGADQVRRWSSALRDLTALEHVVVLDPAAIPAEDSRFLSWSTLHRVGAQRLHTDPLIVDQHWRAITPNRPATVLYTSGTTGAPKGVVLTHRNVVYAASSLRQVFETPPHTSTICYLPLAHIAQRMLGVYLALHNAGHVHFCGTPQDIGAALATVRPHTFFGVPRIWEKLAAAHPGNDARRNATSAARLGLDRASWAASGAAPIGRDVLASMAERGIQVLELWGMTETSGCATTNLPSAQRWGSVGRAVPGVDIRTDDDGEILVRGPIVCAGYLQPDGAIQPVTDSDGWFRTGDAGHIDDGFLTITDRKKELIIDAYGENIAPSAVETALRRHPLIGHALAYGDRRPYLVALLALDDEAAAIWARTHGIEFTRIADLAAHPTVQEEVDRAVAEANAQLNRAEQIKRHRLLDRTWSVESGELTPTSKLRRQVIHELYAEVLDALYA